MVEPGKKKAKANKSNPIKSLPVVPDGYVEGLTEDGKTFIMHQYLLADFQAQISATEKKKRLQLLRTSTGSGIPHRLENYDRITEFETKFLPDPPLFQHDILEQHAKVLALWDNLGISYKDACHRLYLAEVKHLRAERDALFTFEELEEKIKGALNMSDENSSNVDA